LCCWSYLKLAEGEEDVEEEDVEEEDAEEEDVEEEDVEEEDVEEEDVEEAKEVPEDAPAQNQGQALSRESPSTHRSKPPPFARLLSSNKPKLVRPQAR